MKIKQILPKKKEFSLKKKKTQNFLVMQAMYFQELMRWKNILNINKDVSGRT